MEVVDSQHAFQTLNSHTELPCVLTGNRWLIRVE